MVEIRKGMQIPEEGGWYREYCFDSVLSSVSSSTELVHSMVREQSLEAVANIFWDRVELVMRDREVISPKSYTGSSSKNHKTKEKEVSCVVGLPHMKAHGGLGG